MPLQVQSVSPSGLVVLTADKPPVTLENQALGGRVQDGECLTFVLEKDGRSMTLKGTLVWIELTDNHERSRRIELIVDTGGWPGWGEIQAGVSGQ